jgi:O-succinylbenzoic acid--CoA ligase
MITSRIKAGNQWITVSDLKENRLPDSLNKYEKKAIQFCQSWLSDKQDFEFNTSGSTGPPKKILFKRSQLISSARSTSQALDLKAGHTALICLDTDFIAGAMMVVRSFVTGMNMIIKA